MKQLVKLVGLIREPLVVQENIWYLLLAFRFWRHLNGCPLGWQGSSRAIAGNFEARLSVR
jgi:hypothetical protein